MKLAIGSTRAGLILKKDIIDYLKSLGHEADDLGMKEGGDFVPYYESAARVAAQVSAGKYSKAIIICGTGAGSVIVANKFKKVYAVHASSEYEATQAAAVNNANVLCLGEWVTPPQHARRIVEAWLTTKFGTGFEPQWVDFLKDSCDKVTEIETENLK
ncbi:RpiB/LacA/LacB family sugar-phosphate isomerase [candidate division KSB1 bacterium]|nr:RpiB/LacA/LacB family sugar-phosphate isomerase [candidate division KSB1 bacterium]